MDFDAKVIHIRVSALVSLWFHSQTKRGTEQPKGGGTLGQNLEPKGMYLAPNRPGVFLLGPFWCTSFRWASSCLRLATTC